jgi:hypothetical protein
MVTNPQQIDTGLVEHAMGQLENPHSMTPHIIRITIGMLGSIFDSEGNLTTAARDQINAMTDLIDLFQPAAPADVLNDAIDSAVEAIRAALPEGARLSMQVDAEDFCCTVHKGGDWMLEQGAAAGEWYAFDEAKGTCQRNIVLGIDGDPGNPPILEGIQTNVEAGLSLDECRAQNEATQRACA